MFGVAAKADLDHVVGMGELPGVAAQQPGVRLLDLPAVHKSLAEDAEFVANAVADRRQVERRQRIDETGGEAAQATVAQTRLRLQLQKFLQAEVEIGKQLFGDFCRASVEQILPQLLAHHVFSGEVIGEFRVGVVVCFGRLAPALGQQVTHGQRERHVQIVLAGGLDGAADGVVEPLGDGLTQFLFGQGESAGEGCCFDCFGCTHD
jgi:hypothetical protein